jgi:hypothetical protein
MGGVLAVNVCVSTLPTIKPLSNGFYNKQIAQVFLRSPFVTRQDSLNVL